MPSCAGLAVPSTATGNEAMAAAGVVGLQGSGRKGSSGVEEGEGYLRCKAGYTYNRWPVRSGRRWRVVLAVTGTSAVLPRPS